MIEYRAFYKNGERIVISEDDVLTGRFKELLPPGRDIDFPDEVQMTGLPLIKREKNLREMTPEERKRRAGYTLLFGKDIRLSRAIPKELK